MKEGIIEVVMREEDEPRMEERKPMINVAEKPSVVAIVRTLQEPEKVENKLQELLKDYHH